MNSSMIIPFSIIVACLMTISYFIGDIVGSKRTTKKIQRFLESYNLAKTLGQLNVVEQRLKTKPRLFVLKNDDTNRK